MTSVMEVIEGTAENDLRRHYTEEERDILFEAYADACAADNFEEAGRLAAIMPLTPTWAKNILGIIGKEELLANFNITRANEVFGEGWLDEAK